MNSYGRNLAAVLVLGLLSAANASALVIEDNYTGGYDPIVFPTYGVSRDVIGSKSVYQVYSMDVTTAGSIMSVTINTDFIASNPLNTGGFQAGDLFISSDGWTPYGTGKYDEDDHFNGTTWEYAFDTSAGNLVAINDESDFDLVEAGECCRIGQEVLVNGGTDTGAAISFSGPVASNSGIWDYEYTYSFDYTVLGLGPDDVIGLHWAETCGNDVIEGQYQIPSFSVPEPGTAFLLLSGMIALVFTRRRMR